jgi:hypothetical protein
LRISNESTDAIWRNGIVLDSNEVGESNVTRAGDSPATQRTKIIKRRETQSKKNRVSGRGLLAKAAHPTEILLPIR